jgi:hypothetical protein
MPQTGNSFIDTFAMACIFLPLFPAIIIFLKRIYHNDALNFLMILCLLNFIKNILLFIPGLVIVNQITIINIFALPELLILILIFRSLFFGKIKNILTIFLVAFLSSLITYYLLNGIIQKREAMEVLQELVILIVSIVALFELINNNDIHIFKLPLSWIAAGTIFYFSISVLIKVLDTSSAQVNYVANADTQIILDIACFARYILYLLAALFYKHGNYNAEKN